MAGFIFVLRMVLATVIICFMADPAAADRFPDSLQNHLNLINEQIYNEQFDAAGELIDSLPEHPLFGPLRFLFRAALLQTKMKTLETDLGEDEFFEALDSLESRARSLLANESDSVLAYYYLGHSLAFRALYKGLTGHTWAAVKGGLAAGKAYSRGYAIDSSFHDIALGLGSYRYWKSVKTKLVNWTPLFKNEKKNGMELLLKAVDSSEISRDAARTSLIMIYINEKRYAEAIRICEEMKSKYPQGLTFLWAEGEAFFKLGDFHSAARVYENILERLFADPGNCFNIIEAAWRLNGCYKKIGKDNENSDRMALIRKRIETLPISPEIQKRQKKRLKEVLGK